MKRLSILITGASGSGLLSTGEILLKALKRKGLFLHAERNYPSLIKGGHSSFQIMISDHPIYSISETADILVALDRPGFEEYIYLLKNNGLFLHTYEHMEKHNKIIQEINDRNIESLYIPGRKTAEKLGGNFLMVNILLLGMLAKILKIEFDILEKEVTKQFQKKPKLLAINLKCLLVGYTIDDSKLNFQIHNFDQVEDIDKILIDGNTALALGAIHCGVRNYYAYPMSPSSSILTYFSITQQTTNVIVKQAEDEITAVQMALGSMHMGSRALVATSGGGYDLMTETISLAGMIETPLVVIIAQRPGPATGLPTWTAQADINLAIYSSHGEFPRIVIAGSDPTSCFYLIQEAFNKAEKYQIPVIFLTEKTIAEAKTVVPIFKQKTIMIERGLSNTLNVKWNERYQYHKSGISKRWLPGSSEEIYFANGDEHKEDGTLGEDKETARKMAEKRKAKQETIYRELPEPIIYGKQKAQISFIGFGSSKNVVKDIIKIYEAKNIDINYLHFDYIFPLKTEKLLDFFQMNKKVYLIEGNALGQFGNLIEGRTNYRFHDKLLKYDGRPFYTEDIIEFIDKRL